MSRAEPETNIFSHEKGCCTLPRVRCSVFCGVLVHFGAVVADAPCETLGQERGAPKRGGRCCGRVPPMFKGGKKAPQATAPDQSSSQNVHFDWEQRDFTQTIQLGMTQLTAFLNEFGARRHLTLHPRACCNDWRAVCRWNHARANCSAKR